jgi:hypothetical protein
MKIQNLLTSIFVLPSVGLVSLLSGCGGSGGGAGGNGSGVASSNPFVRWSAITPPQSVFMEGVSQDADYTAGPAPAYPVTSVTDRGVHTNSSATIRYLADGSIGAVSVTTPNGSVSWDEATGDTITAGILPGLVVASDPTGRDVGLAADALDPALAWDYQTFGIWETGRGTGTGTFGGITLGAPTAGAAIPTFGAPTFTGFAGGAYVDATGTNDYITASSLTVNANFVGRSLDFITTGTQKTHTQTRITTSAIDLNMTGTLTYAPATNSFSGAVNANGGMTGSATGRFYGPNAEELGGVFAVRAPVPGVESHAGAFGAKR